MMNSFPDYELLGKASKILKNKTGPHNTSLLKASLEKYGFP